MARPKKLTPAAVKSIFKSSDPAAKVGARFGVSTNLVYLIRSGRIHKKITSTMSAPAKAPAKQRAATIAAGINMNALADAIIDRLMARLFAKSGR
jgi:hypothetical protein